MRSALVGVIGHVDHGKTALVRALTGKDTDRLKEEKERGVSILPGFAVLRTPGGEIDLVDLPGHERFVRAMISGATGMNAVLLAVAANEGVKPQTIEHLEIARLLGIRRGVVALTKADLVSDAALLARRNRVSALCREYGLSDVPLVAASTLSGQGIAELAQCLANLVENPGAPCDDGFAYLPIDRAFVVPGFGPIVTGTLRRGSLSIGDRVVLRPGDREARVRSLQVHGRSIRTVTPGRRTAVALRGVEIAELGRGMALSSPESLVEANWIDATITCVPGSPSPLRSGQAVQLLFGTTETAARLRLLDGDAVSPGETALGQLHCQEAVAVPAREPFILRLVSPSITVGGGRVLNPSSHRRRRGSAPPVLIAMAAGRSADALLARLEEVGPAGCETPALARFVGVSEARLRRKLRHLGMMPEDGARVAHPAVWDAMARSLLDGLDRHHRERPLEHGLTREGLRPLLPQEVDPAIAEALLRSLAAQGRLAADQGLFRLPDFDPAQQASGLTRDLALLFREAGLNPPDESAVVGRDRGRQEAIRFLLRQGTLVRAVDRVQERAVLFHREPVEEAKRRIAERWRDGQGFRARDAGALLGISRKYSIPLLEHLDAVRFTVRRGDERTVLRTDGTGRREVGDP